MFRIIRSFNILLVRCTRHATLLEMSSRPSIPLGSKIKAVIFDLDGTLIDTEPAAAKAITECFREWGIQIVAYDANFITGRTWEMAFGYLFKKYELPVPA